VAESRHTPLNWRATVVACPDSKTANFVEGGEQTFTLDSHGTAVTGVIAARANNAEGIFGIAPQADIVAVKACWQRTPGHLEAVCSSWTLAKALDFTIHTGVQIVNLSLAGPPDSLLARLITKALDSGITVVAAALQEGEQAPGFPASMETVIAVLASDPQGQVRGAAGMTRPSLLAAPGIDILTTMPQQVYDFLSGSSLAAAHVSGIAALLLELEPQLSAAQMHALLRATVQPVRVTHSVSSASIGQVDACTALEQLMGRTLCP
jgi:subtilisin family serine protease